MGSVRGRPIREFLHLAEAVFGCGTKSHLSPTSCLRDGFGGGMGSQGGREEPALGDLGEQERDQIGDVKDFRIVGAMRVGLVSRAISASSPSRSPHSRQTFL